MYLGLEDFDVDIFLRLEDENIFIYYIDFETIPQLSNMVPLGSFDSDEKFQFIKLKMADRIQVGLEFMIRDQYAKRDPLTDNVVLLIENFIREFENIPEVIQRIEEYTDLCKSNTPPVWCSSCNNDCPDYCRNQAHCAIEIPIEVFTEEDLYYLIVVYFNGIYRTNPLESQEFGPYEILTDINFDLNKYSLIVDIHEFFTKEFQWFLSTTPGAAPFSKNFGTTIKKAVQTKNDGVRQRMVEDEINYFIQGFNSVYGNLVNIQSINIVSKESNIGADSWQIDVFASIKKERLIYRVEF